MEDEVKDIITKEHMTKIMKEVTKRMAMFRKVLMTDYDIYFSNKNLSEIVGQVMGKVSAQYYTTTLKYAVDNAHSDKEPDLYFTKIKIPIEIKVTSTLKAWTGGEFSKRPFHYLLVSWGGNFDEFFICFVKLDKVDWKSNIESGFYGPSLPTKKLLEKKDKLILFGSIDEKGRITREKI